MTPTIALASLVLACTGTGPIYNGVQTYEYFPIEGERTWRYAMEDDSAGYLLEVEKVDSRSENGTEVVTLEYRRSDTMDLLYSTTWSSDAAGGIRVYSYEMQGGESVTYSPPVEFAEYTMRPGDEVVTETGGMTFTSTYVGVENCPNLWVSDVWECLHFSIDDGDGDDMVGAPFAGDWWIAGSWGPSIFQPTGWTSPWVLTNAYYCDPGVQECD